VSDYLLRRALNRAHWRVVRHDGRAITHVRIGHGAQDTRRVFRAMALTVDSTSQARSLPSDLTTWIGHELRAGDLRLTLTPIAATPGAPRWARDAVRAHVLEHARHQLAGNLAR
jgi:hypothetical protein